MHSRRRWLLSTLVGAGALTAPSVARADDCVDININTFLQAFPIRPESSKFKHIADVTLAGLFASGEWNTLYDKYFGPSSKSPFPMTDTLKALAVMNAWPAQ